MAMIVYFLDAVFFFWLVVVTWFLYRSRKHYFSLIKRTRSHNIDDILDSLISHDKTITKEVESIEKKLREIDENATAYFQKVGIVHFNAFGKTGNEQSFVIALLDKKNRGFTINFIYTHEGVRVYSKKVEDGKGVEYSLSEEEIKAIGQVTTK